MKLLTLLLIIIPASIFAQEVEYSKKTKEVSIDGVVSFKIEKKKSDGIYYEIFDKEGDKVFRMNYFTYNDYTKISKNNPNGSVGYWQFVFLKSGQKAESGVIGNMKKVAKFLIENKLMVDGLLNQEAVDEFILVNGNKYSDFR